MHFEFSSGRCLLFGILNVTPDSFSDGGRYLSVEFALQHALQLERDGADVIDVGGESTRPGAPPVSVEDEIKRVIPVIQTLKRHLHIPLSIDTTKAVVAEAALAEGTEIVNDISGLTADSRMASVVSSSKANLILMHSRGTPQTMQTLCGYQNVVEEVKQELQEKVQSALSAGILKDRIAIDPGIGFAKTAEQNLILLNSLKRFASLFINSTTMTFPVLVGVSRKSFLGGKLEDRGSETLAAELQVYQQGIRMIRTHDIAALKQSVIKINCDGNL